jgi:hypothetical protein
MGAQRRRGAHGDGCTVVWRALLSRPEVSAAATSTASTPAPLALVTTPGTAPGSRRPRARPGRVPRLPPPAGALRNWAHTSRLSPPASGALRASVSRAPRPPPPLCLGPRLSPDVERCQLQVPDRSAPWRNRPRPSPRGWRAGLGDQNPREGPQWRDVAREWRRHRNTQEGQK